MAIPRHRHDDDVAKPAASSLLPPATSEPISAAIDCARSADRNRSSPTAQPARDVARRVLVHLCHQER